MMHALEKRFFEQEGNKGLSSVGSPEDKKKELEKERIWFVFFNQNNSSNVKVYFLKTTRAVSASFLLRHY